MNRHLLAAALFLGLSAAMTWPLARNLGTAVSDPGDPYITVWILDWDWYATLHQPLHLFDANAFHPARYSLAFSENLYGLAALLFPFRALGLDALTTHNLGILLGFAFCGFAAYLLGLHLTGSWTAGFAAGVFYAFLPYRFVHLSHIQHIWGGWLPLLLLMLLRYAQNSSRRNAILFAAAFAMNGLTNIHLLFFGTFACAVTAVLLLRREQWRALALPMLGAMLVLAPFLYPYAAAAKLYGMQRGVEEVWRFSAAPRDWIADSAEPELRLSPGWLAYLFVVLSMFVGEGRRQKAEGRTPPVRFSVPRFCLLPSAFCLSIIWIAIGFAGSLGLHFFFHEFLFYATPGWRAIRVPARWAAVSYTGFAIAIALVTAAMPKKLRWLAPLVFVLTLWNAPIRWYLAQPETPPVYRSLKNEVIAELPINTPLSEYESMLRSTAHHNPMINGISGFEPPVKRELAALAYGDGFADALKRAGVERVIVRANLLGDRAAAVKSWLRRELDRGTIRFVRRYDNGVEGDWVFAFGRGAMTRQLQDFLDGRIVCGSNTSGWLDYPQPATVFRGDAIFSGWAWSPHGIASVELSFANGATTMRAHLRDELTPCGMGKRFVLVFPKRPDAIREESDVQAAVTDGKGERTRFDDRWMRWERPR